MICPRNVPSALFRTAVVLACFAFGAPALGQDVGDVMQVYERAENQVKTLNTLVPVTEKQMVAVTIAIKNFGAAKTPDAVVGTMQQALDAFRANERSLENLSLVLQDLAGSFRGLRPLEESKAGAEQIKSLRRSIANADVEFSKLAEAGFREEDWLQATRQQVNVARSALESEEQAKLLRQAEQHRNNAEGLSNLQAAGEVLSRLSMMVDVAKITNHINRELVKRSAVSQAKDSELRERLERIFGAFKTPVEVGNHVESLVDSANEAMANIVQHMFETGGAGFPDFSQQDIDDYLAWEERPREVTCEQCTDGLDNDLNGLTDAEQSASCKLFVLRDASCTQSNAF